MGQQPKKRLRTFTKQNYVPRVSRHLQAKRDWKEMETKKDDVRRLSNKCVGLKALLLQHAPGNQVSSVWPVVAGTLYLFVAVFLR